MAESDATRDPLSRAAIRQIAWLGLVCTVGFALLMVTLSFATRLTGSGTDTTGAVDFDTRTITLYLEVVGYFFKVITEGDFSCKPYPLF